MSVLGEAIIARSIDAMRIEDRHGNRWQYHSRSDRHSKIACWAVLFDVMRSCELLREHVAAGKVGFGINHELHDFKQNRKKNLDLVVAKPSTNAPNSLTFSEYGKQVQVCLSEADAAELANLPVLRAAAVSNVLVALEAKACMTEHQKARPRLFDELASSFQTIHGDTNSAIAAAFVMINCANSFVSPDRNRKKVRAGKYILNPHKQPAAATGTLEKVMQLPRRSDEREHGFDALGVTMVDCPNDGTSVSVAAAMNGMVDKIVTYPSLIQRVSHLYSTKFRGL